MENRYEAQFINYASKMDALTENYGKFVKICSRIIEEKDEKATALLITEISKVIKSEKYSTEIKKIAGLLNDSLVRYYGYEKISQICSEEKEMEDPRTLEELLNDLNSLIGLEKVKKTVEDLITYQKVQKMRRENNLHTVKGTLHMAFIGNPGTGKTTVARIVGRIYKKLGLLSKGHFIEVSRTDLIAGYQGQTALKVKKVIEKAKGGVLFIDEAYSITENESSDSYGRECLTELTKALEDYRDDLVVIVAGYTGPMNKFFQSNPGLKSRFNTFIEFDDYSSVELDKILSSMCLKNDYRLDEDAQKKIHNFFERKISSKDDNFANGRLARNIYDDLVMNHARRVIKIKNPECQDLSTIKAEDFIECNNY